MLPDTNENRITDENMLSVLERELENITTAEVMRGLDKDELERRGFIGPGRIGIPRSTNSLIDDRTGLQFESGVAYERLPDTADILLHDMETLGHIPDVLAGTVVATRKKGERNPTKCGQNIRNETGENNESFIALINGKVVLVGDTISIIPGDRNAMVQITVSSDHLHAFARCTPARGMGIPLTAETVLSELAKAGVTFGIDEAEICKRVAAANTCGAPSEEFTAAAGVFEANGTNGSAILNFENGPPEYDFQILPGGRVDYHKTCHIVMVKKDTAIATLTEATPGTNGTTVLGEVIEAGHGEPAALIAGPGVRTGNGGKTLFAEADGCVIVNGSLISVISVFVVDGDVDFSTGNIDFNGSVVVNGAICDGFEVKAEGDIIVSRNIEGARVEAGRDIVIRGGIQGQSKGLVSAGRNITAGYAQNARLEAQGDICLRNFAINSYIFTSKRLTMQENRGAILGGEVYAQKGIDVRSIGSENGTKTLVTAGTDFLVKRVIGELEEAIQFCETNLQKIETALKMIVKSTGEIKNLPPARLSVVQKIMTKRREIGRHLTIMNTKRKDLLRESVDKDVCYVKVKTTCYSDVLLKIKDCLMAIREKRQAVRFYEDKKTGTIGIGAY